VHLPASEQFDPPDAAAIGEGQVPAVRVQPPPRPRVVNRAAISLEAGSVG